MFDTILIGASGMLANSAALKVVSNNLSNVNTPGFKSSQPEFASLFEQGSNPNRAHAGPTQAGEGQGVETVGSTINFSAGSDLATGDPLNVLIKGNGFFAVKRGNEVLYTREGDFSLNADGVLVNTAGDHVLGLDSAGRLGDISVANLMHDMPKATSVVKFVGNITSTVSSPAVSAQVNNITVYDTTGVPQTLSLSITNNGSGNFTVTATDAHGTTIGSGVLQFSAAGAPQSGRDTVTISMQPSGSAAFPVTFDFSSNVVSIGSANSIAFSGQDGYAGGVRSGQSIDADGYLTIQYSNGQTQKGPRLALADFDSVNDVQDAGGTVFRANANAAVYLGHAGENTFGNLSNGHREGSNVDLSTEFSNLILMQRGYQAASHVVSVANDIIQELYDMKGHR